MAVPILLCFLHKRMKPHHGTVFTLGLNLPRALGWFPVSADKTSFVPAESETRHLLFFMSGGLLLFMYPVDKTSVVSADETSVYSQGIPQALATQGRPL